MSGSVRSSNKQWLTWHGQSLHCGAIVRLGISWSVQGYISWIKLHDLFDEKLLEDGHYLFLCVKCMRCMKTKQTNNNNKHQKFCENIENFEKMFWLWWNCLIEVKRHSVCPLTCGLQPSTRFFVRIQKSSFIIRIMSIFIKN